MRLPRRFPLSHCGMIFSLLAVLSGAALAQSSNPGTQPAQSAQKAPSAQSQLSAKWNDAMRALAEKIAAAAGPSHEISLDVKNISTLDPVEVTAIRQALQGELRRREILVTPVRMSEAQVQVTLSEGAGGRVFVVDIHHGPEQQISLLPVPNEPAFVNGRQRERLTLTAKFVWEQPERFLDFMLLDGIPEAQSVLLVVETDRLAYYQSKDLQWSVSRTIPIRRFRPAPRDVRGRIILPQNKIVLTDAECSGRLASAEDVHCSFTSSLNVWPTFVSYLPGHDRTLAIPLYEMCNEEPVTLASGTGDWTQPDSLQAFERTQSEPPPIPVGNALDFEGPIMSLLADKEDDVARVVVHNLKTGNYEAYLVTATCSR
jgi:hypothetical protein